MKMQPDRLDGVNMISRWEGSRLWVHQTRFDHSVLVPHRGLVQPWAPTDMASLNAEAFEAVVALKPELVIFGSGSGLVFPSPALWAPLVSRGIGFEAMDSAAACRTYNVLASEGRAVLAALLLGGETGG